MGDAMSRIRLIFERQWIHAALLAALLAGAALIGGFDAVRSGRLWGVPTQVWFCLSVACAIAHQVYVWLCWRTQLHAALFTRALGRAGFPVYAAGFAALGAARIVLIFCLAISNRDSLPGNLFMHRTFAVITAIPAIYLVYSVTRYFGFRRAFGLDHFDAACRSVPFVRRGIFRFTRNGMYVYGFLLLWVPALWFASPAALTAALFNHLYIWVHYFSTELPDMKRIYGEGSRERRPVKGPGQQ
jgi:protein-S-isoprenylcysteine O-methyltransferase Ste14